MKPFDDYPEGGYTILRTRTGDLARQGYGHWLVERRQTSCAYCGISLVESYAHWLLLAVDHVIPEKEAQRLKICRSWYDSYSNLVLACSGCNGFCNQYKVLWQEPKPESTEGHRRTA